MGISATLYGRVLAPLEAACAGEDRRTVRSLGWLVTGLLLEQDARLSRIALAMGSATSAASRQRQLLRLLDSGLDPRRCYRRWLRREFEGWYVRRATMLLDTTSVAGRLYFVRLALAHGQRAIPLAWRTYEGTSATVGFDGYRELLEEAELLLPSRLERVLLADRGFQHLELMSWCQLHGWHYRIRAKSHLSVRLPDGTERSVGTFRSKVGTMRLLDTAYVGAAGLGPVGLVLCWPRYGQERTLHVLSPDAPSVRTLAEFSRRAAIERAFRDDKSACFGIERVRLTSPARLDCLLLGIAIAQVLLISMATRLLLTHTGAAVDTHGEGGLSLLQLGARHLRSEVWQGRTPRLGICLLPDELTEDASDERRRLRAFYHRLGLTPGEQWVPPDSFEERNLMWWLPGNIKRYKPRLPIGDPPLIWGRE
jgi:hypothetical protein